MLRLFLFLSKYSPTYKVLFSKDKENAPQNGKKVCKTTQDESAEVTGNSTFYQPVELSQASSQESLKAHSFTSDGVITASVQVAEEYFLGERDQTPPPLPPKPKHLPVTSRPRRTVYLDQPSSSFVWQHDQCIILNSELRFLGEIYISICYFEHCHFSKYILKNK